MDSNEERQMFKATCSDCNCECEVPFEPIKGKPVRCQDCFKKSRPKRSFNGGGRFQQERQMHNAKCSDCGKECQVPFKPTEGKSVRCKECYIKSKEN